MTRLTATEMRDLANSAKRARIIAERTKAGEAKRIALASAKSQARRDEIWRTLYRASIDGHDQAELVNISIEDLEYFKKLGLYIEETFKRKRNRSTFANEILKLKRLITKNDLEIEKLESKIDEFSTAGPTFDTSPLEDWLYEYQSVAYACDMEAWFGVELNRIFIIDRSGLLSLQMHAEEMLSLSKDAARIKALKELLRETKKASQSGRQAFDVEAALSKTKELGAVIQQSEDRIAEIEEDEQDYIRDSYIRSVFTLQWKRHSDLKLLSDFDEFSYESLKWFCSHLGQVAFKAFDLDVQAAAKRGEKQLQLRWVNHEPQIFVANDAGTFSGKFPRWFDFKEALTLLGYKVSERKSTPMQIIVVRW